MPQVTIEFSGAGRALSGVRSLTLSIEKGETYRQIVKKLAQSYPNLIGVIIDTDGQSFLSSTMFNRNDAQLIMPEMMDLSPEDGDILMIVSLITGGSACPEMTQYIVPLFPLLRCPNCAAQRQIDWREGEYPFEVTFTLAPYHLFCNGCKTPYPITDDFIPLLWDEEVKPLYLTTALPVNSLAANKAIYDRISNDYQQFTRQDQAIGQRMRTGAGRIRKHIEQNLPVEEGKRLVHIDFGCGPGNVLGWLKQPGWQQIGLDVSLQNLRNARKNTACLVVCGNACNMPFADGVAHLVTESSVLHHIQDWKAALTEAARICHPSGGIIIDSEPSHEQMAWSRLAVAVFNARFPVYKALSGIWRSKYVFRNLEEARLNVQAEIHHQPGTGFPVEEIRQMFTNWGMTAEIILSPTPELTSKAQPKIKNIILNLLSARNPWDPRFGAFTAIILSSVNIDSSGR